MKYSIKPEKHELQQAHQVVEKSIESSKHALQKEQPLRIHLGYAEKEEVGDFGVFGEATDSKNGRIYFNTSKDTWKQNLTELTIDIYGQAWFYEKIDKLEFVWQQLLAETTGLLLLDKISEGREPDYNGLQGEWKQKKENLSEEIASGNKAYSWQLKLIVGRKLLDDYDLEDLPTLNKSDLIEAGDKAFL